MLQAEPILRYRYCREHEPNSALRFQGKAVAGRILEITGFDRKKHGLRNLRLCIVKSLNLSPEEHPEASFEWFANGSCSDRIRDSGELQSLLAQHSRSIIDVHITPRPVHPPAELSSQIQTPGGADAYTPIKCETTLIRQAHTTSEVVDVSLTVGAAKKQNGSRPGPQIPPALAPRMQSQPRQNRHPLDSAPLKTGNAFAAALQPSKASVPAQAGPTESSRGVATHATGNIPPNVLQAAFNRYAELELDMPSSCTYEFVMRMLQRETHIAVLPCSQQVHRFPEAQNTPGLLFAMGDLCDEVEYTFPNRVLNGFGLDTAYYRVRFHSAHACIDSSIGKLPLAPGLPSMLVVYAHFQLALQQPFGPTNTVVALRSLRELIGPGPGPLASFNFHGPAPTNQALATARILAPSARRERDEDDEENMKRFNRPVDAVKTNSGKRKVRSEGSKDKRSEEARRSRRNRQSF